MTYYIDYNVDKQKHGLKAMNKLFYKFYVIDVDNNKKCIYINKKYINTRAYKSINKYLNNHNLEPLSCNAMISKEIQIDEENNVLNGIRYIPKEKNVMKLMLYDILKYIEHVVDTDCRNESLYVAMINDNNKEILINILDLFKSINIVTTRLGSIRRMEKRIQKYKDTIISISNNKKKALRRAKILINFDFSSDLLNEFDLNKDCIIINLNINKINLNRSFRGSIINAIQIDFQNRYEEQINKCKYDLYNLYNSYIEHLNYHNAMEFIENDKCKIVNLVGNRGQIANKEIVNNFTNSAIKLDKIRKMN